LRLSQSAFGEKLAVDTVSYVPLKARELNCLRVTTASFPALLYYVAYSKIASCMKPKNAKINYSLLYMIIIKFGDLSWHVIGFPTFYVTLNALILYHEIRKFRSTTKS
jgi:hypothetical protein